MWVCVCVWKRVKKDRSTAYCTTAYLRHKPFLMLSWGLRSINGSAYRFKLQIGSVKSLLLSLRLTHSNNENLQGTDWGENSLGLTLRIRDAWLELHFRLRLIASHMACKHSHRHWRTSIAHTKTTRHVGLYLLTMHCLSKNNNPHTHGAHGVCTEFYGKEK